jgi:FtsP/CotA-like multicopper oxidase with cupredoxin domain
MQRHIKAFTLGGLAVVFPVVLGCTRPPITPAPGAQPPAPAAATPAAATAAAALASSANCQPGQDLITIPEIRSDTASHRLRAEIELTSGKRTLWGSIGDPRCAQQDLRYFTGRNLLAPGPDDPAFAKGDPIPGPTLRARVGDLIEVRFLNNIDTQQFANTLDQSHADPANSTGCDEVRSDGGGLFYPKPGGDVMPNCIHGSSTANLHFHGTHTTPSTTGDNVLLYVTPSLRSGTNRSELSPSPAFVNREFDKVFSACEAGGSPSAWAQLPSEWRTDQERLLKRYDEITPFRGKPGALPHDMQLWPTNEGQIAAGAWPQYQLGAFPYCFRLANDKPADGREAQKMGQAPGTHWYHAHKHGSTALNVANGMAGAFVIEGQYDDDLRKFYGAGFRDQVLVVQQLSTQPFGFMAPSPEVPNKPPVSVNGRLNPVVRMRPGEVQLWRLVNANFRLGVEFQSIAPQAGLAWRQIAQDGVQFAFDNYKTLGAMNRRFNLGPGNRTDLLVRAASEPGTYTVTVQTNDGLAPDPGLNPPVKPDAPVVLLTVKVEGDRVVPAQDFIARAEDFPALPAFLNDIPAASIAQRRTMDFGAGLTLDGKLFDGSRFSQVMLLNDAEEWTITSQARDMAHPFHIHVNPFQITEVFQPNLENTKDPSQPCYVDPLNPQTWKPCKPFAGPYVWWDTFPIPPAAAIPIPASVCTGAPGNCPAPIRPYTTCTATQCTVTIPGRFKMRTRFVDYTGAFVVHCHILMHEDRGMMQLVEVVLDKTPYGHK